jgi:hypothetical protein
MRCVPRKNGHYNLIPKKKLAYFSNKKKLEIYLKNNSSIASNRLVKRKDSSGKFKNDLIPSRYLDDNQSEKFKRYPFNNEISRSTFLKYLNKNGVFKHPTRLTNICDYCEWARNTKKDVIKMLKSNSNV